MTGAYRFLSCAAAAILTLSVAAPAPIDRPDPPYLDGSSADVQCVLFEVVDRSGGSASP